MHARGTTKKSWFGRVMYLGMALFVIAISIVPFVKIIDYLDRTEPVPFEGRVEGAVVITPQPGKTEASYLCLEPVTDGNVGSWVAVGAQNCVAGGEALYFARLKESAVGTAVAPGQVFLLDQLTTVVEGSVFGTLKTTKRINANLGSPGRH